MHARGSTTSAKSIFKSRPSCPSVIKYLMFLVSACVSHIDKKVDFSCFVVMDRFPRSGYIIIWVFLNELTVPIGCFPAFLMYNYYTAT